jgi:RpiB/LacA/LacB family sugar-phosphate isomerase
MTSSTVVPIPPTGSITPTSEQRSVDRSATAATVWDVTSARLTREHNDANVICIGERLVGPQVAKDCVDAWLGAIFEGGRHEGRVAKIDGLGGEQA